VPEKNKSKEPEAVGETNDIDIEKVKRLAERGDPNGLYAMGTAYLFGWEVEEDLEKGFKMLEAACEKGQPNAMTLLVRLYMSQNYFMEPKKAFEYAEKGADAGLSDAQLFLGTAYLDGFVVEQDYKKAEEWFRKAARQGNPEAKNSLAYIYQEGLGVEIDLQKAFKLYKNAAAAGNINSQYQTGAYYEGGIGVKCDLKKASEWYMKAAEQGDAYAMERLGIIYNCGSSEFPQDPVQSFEWFLKAAQGGMLGAMYYVGIYYIEGFGVETDKEDGMKWLRLAASSGNEEAKELVAKLENTGVQ
jgi:TPR repeat protein